MKGRIDGRANTIKPAEYLKLAQELVLADIDIRKATEFLAQARGVKAGIVRRAKEAGADVEAMRSLADLKRMDDEDRNRLLETVYKYASWEGVKLYVEPTAEKPQGALFADDAEAGIASQGLQDARVTSDAFNSWREGGTLENNPYEPGSRDHQTWTTAWKDADRDMPAAKPKAAKPSSAKKPVAAAEGEAPKRGPGRPRKPKDADPIGEPAGTA